ncbi:MAG TPA: circadian clock KaiB family protein [Verrucomicrobiae bacterium]
MPIKKSKPKSPRAPKAPVNSAKAFEKLLKAASVIQHYSLRLYITGSTARSTEAVTNVRALCEEYLKGRYNLEVIDIYQQPTEAMDEQIIAAPTLIKALPKPPKRLIGNLSNRDKVIIGLDLHGKKTGRGTKWSKV